MLIDAGVKAAFNEELVELLDEIVLLLEDILLEPQPITALKKTRIDSDANTALFHKKKRLVIWL